MNNCAGGITPWGTWLMSEENFTSYFIGDVDQAGTESANHRRYGIFNQMRNGRYWGAQYVWGRYYDRFDVSREPNEPNRFG